VKLLFDENLSPKLPCLLADLFPDSLHVRDVGMKATDDPIVVATEGSHRQFKHPTKKGRVTVPRKPNNDLPIGTFNSILRQAGLKN
jgi:hypothetical protein